MTLLEKYYNSWVYISTVFVFLLFFFWQCYLDIKVENQIWYNLNPEIILYLKIKGIEKKIGPGDNR